VATGLQTDVIEIDYNDGAFAQNVTRSIQGSGASPALIAISELDPYDYGTLAQGAISTHIFMLTNSGGVDATSLAGGGGLAPPFSYVGGAFPGNGGDCTPILAPAASCRIEVEFAPTNAGNFTGTIDIAILSP